MIERERERDRETRRTNKDGNETGLRKREKDGRHEENRGEVAFIKLALSQHRTIIAEWITWSHPVVGGKASRFFFPLFSSIPRPPPGLLLPLPCLCVSSHPFEARFISTAPPCNLQRRPLSLLHFLLNHQIYLVTSTRLLLRQTSRHAAEILTSPNECSMRYREARPNARTGATGSFDFTREGASLFPAADDGTIVIHPIGPLSGWKTEREREWTRGGRRNEAKQRQGWF